MRKTPSEAVQRWLDSRTEDGRFHSAGRFTVDPVGAKAAGVEPLRLSDVPLLLLAGAVEAGSSWFAVQGGGDVRLCWQGQMGPSGAIASSLLRHHDVDFAESEGQVHLPPFFRDLLDPLMARCRHAPLRLLWHDRLLSSGSGEGTLGARRSSIPRLVFVDRGIDFELNLFFPDLEVVAWVPPLTGAPWPRCLAAGKDLERQLLRVARTLAAGVPGESRRTGLL